MVCETSAGAAFADPSASAAGIRSVGEVETGVVQQASSITGFGFLGVGRRGWAVT